MLSRVFRVFRVFGAIRGLPGPGGRGVSAGPAGVVLLDAAAGHVGEQQQLPAGHPAGARESAADRHLAALRSAIPAGLSPLEHHHGEPAVRLLRGTGRQLFAVLLGAQRCLPRARVHLHDLPNRDSAGAAAAERTRGDAQSWSLCVVGSRSGGRERVAVRVPAAWKLAEAEVRVARSHEAAV